MFKYGKIIEQLSEKLKQFINISIELLDDNHNYIFQKKFDTKTKPVHTLTNKLDLYLDASSTLPVTCTLQLDFYDTQDKEKAELTLFFISSLLKFNSSSYHQLVSKISFAEDIIAGMPHGFLVLKKDLSVTHANEAAAKILETTRERLLTDRLDKVILSELRVKEIFKTGQPIIDEEIFIKLPNRTVNIIKTAIPLKDKDGKVTAVLDHFREMREARKMVSNMVGSKARFTFSDIICASSAMADTIEQIRMACPSPLSILLYGESGTGKEMFAHAIHNASPRSQAPFIIIDCSAIPRELVESELFGYKEGAFTGSKRGGQPGKFELANGGTVFLDEIGELPLELQAKFLRVLQNRQIVRLGTSEPIPIDIRIIAATNRSLQKEIELGNFREDLFYRLNVLSFNIPPLRERPEDILALAEFFLQKYQVRIGKTGLSFSPATIEYMLNHHWAGNARELENLVARAVQMANNSIAPEHLNRFIYQPTTILKPMAQATQNKTSNPKSLCEHEYNILQQTLTQTRGNISEVARILGVARSTVYKKMKKFNIS